MTDPRWTPDTTDSVVDYDREGYLEVWQTMEPPEDFDTPTRREAEMWER